MQLVFAKTTGMAPGISLELDTSIYSLEAIKKAAYRLGDRSAILISPGKSSSVVVSFQAFNDSQTPNLDKVISDFKTELIDQDLREIIKRETAALRNLILAHAFSRTALAENS